MRPDIYRVKEIGSGSLAIMAKPVSGEFIEDEFQGIAREGINRIVSLLEPHEEYAVGLSNEADLSSRNGIDFVSHPIIDRGLPSSLPKFCGFISSIHSGIQSGTNTVVHCRAGIGRAGIVVASVLVRSGMDAESAFELVSEKRGVSVPDTEEQLNWVVAHQKALRETT